MTGIYKITSPTNKVYIGQSVDIFERWRQHSKFCHSGKLRNSFKKYGVETHTFEVIEECSVELLNERERHWQDFYDVLGENGLNLCLQKTEIKKVITSEETRRKISIATKGKIVSEESKKRISESKRGRKLTEETKKKIGLAAVGRVCTEETRKKLSKSNTGKVPSKEARRKMSEKSISEEHKKKISEFQKERARLKLIGKNKENDN